MSKKSVTSPWEGVTWIEGVHYRLVGEAQRVETIKVPPGVQTVLDRKGNRVPKWAIVIRYNT